MSAESERYIVAGSRPWVRRVYDEELVKMPGEWHYAAASADLDLEKLRALRPRYIFFVHWSDKVPAELHERYECVCFHMTDVPYGRGGSPLQNLIVRGHRATKLTALKMVEGFDAGPVYFKEDLALDGTAEEIYVRASGLAARMIRRLIAEHPVPAPQEGDPVVFRRRKPSESELPRDGQLDALYDFIRMLDAEGYPHAFIQHGAFRLEFGKAVPQDGALRAEVVIRKVDPT